MRAWGLVAALLFISACGQQEAAPPAAPETPPIIAWSEVPAEAISAADGVFYTVVDVGGQPAAEITNVPADASPAGPTGGLSIRLPDEIEGQASGKQVRVTVRAAGVADTTLGVAYSTNDVGNSGWREFPVTTTPADYSFTYDVPAMNTGRGDYLGFRNYGDGRVQVLGYRVDVIGPPAQ